MPSENKTPNIGLNMWRGNEYPKRSDFVADNTIIDTKIKDLTAQSNEIATELKFSELSSVATNIDAEGIYKDTEWRRKDGTIYAKSQLLGESPYAQIKVDYYNELGTGIIKTIIWNLAYDENDFIFEKVVV